MSRGIGWATGIIAAAAAASAVVWVLRDSPTAAAPSPSANAARMWPEPSELKDAVGIPTPTPAPEPRPSRTQPSVEQAPPTTPEEIEAHRIATERAFMERVARHRLALRDESFVAEYEEPLRTALASQRIQDAGAQLLSVDCRTNTCLATFRWEDFGSAAGGWQPILHTPDVRCAREIVLPQPSDPDASYDGHALFFACPAE